MYTRGTGREKEHGRGAEQHYVLQCLPYAAPRSAGWFTVKLIQASLRFPSRIFIARRGRERYEVLIYTRVYAYSIRIYATIAPRIYDVQRYIYYRKRRASILISAVLWLQGRAGCFCSFAGGSAGVMRASFACLLASAGGDRIDELKSVARSLIGR